MFLSQIKNIVASKMQTLMLQTHRLTSLATKATMRRDSISKAMSPCLARPLERVCTVTPYFCHNNGIIGFWNRWFGFGSKSTIHKGLPF